MTGCVDLELSVMNAANFVSRQILQPPVFRLGTQGYEILCGGFELHSGFTNVNSRLWSQSIFRIILEPIPIIPGNGTEVPAGAAVRAEQRLTGGPDSGRRAFSAPSAGFDVHRSLGVRLPPLRPCLLQCESFLHNHCVSLRARSPLRDVRLPDGLTLAVSFDDCCQCAASGSGLRDDW